MIVLITIAFVAFMQTAQQIRPTPQEFSTATVSVRRVVMSATLEQIQPPNAVSADSIEYITRGLGDTDQEVRKLAFSGLGFMAMRQAVGGGSPLLDSAAKSRVAPLIRQGLRDTDEGIRAFALNALLLVGGDVPNDTEDALIAQYRSDSSPLVRRQAVARLRESASPSLKARSLLVEALKDPNDGVKQQAAIGIRELKPSQGLAALAAALLSGVKDRGPRGSIVSAFAAYGQAAEEYVPLLLETLKEEIDPAVRAEIERTLVTIRR